MYLSDRDFLWAIKMGKIIFEPPPKESDVDSTSIDLHLGPVNAVRTWDTRAYLADRGDEGTTRPELKVGEYKFETFSRKWAKPVPRYSSDKDQLVGLRHEEEIVVKPGGFLLWPTREKVGTPADAEFILFVDGKSRKARAGIVIHLTAPTIHATWSGRVTLEIANLGPWDIVLREGDSIAQLKAARISSPPEKRTEGRSTTYGQTGIHGGETPPKGEA